LSKANNSSQSVTQLQTEDNLSFVSAVLGALGSTLTTPSAATTTISTSLASPTLLAGVFLAAVAKTLPSLKQDSRSWEDWFLFAFAVLGALAAGIEAQTNLYSAYPYLPILLLLIGILGKTLIPLSKKGKREWKGWKVEDWLTAIIAIVVLILLPFAPQIAPLGAFIAFLTKTLTSSAK